MTSSERRRADRHPVDLAGTLFLAEGDGIAVRIKNLGQLGALVQVSDLEHIVREGDRAILDHPVFGAQGDRRRSPCGVVRVDLEFEGESVNRELAVYFDGGAAPSGYAEPSSEST